MRFALGIITVLAVGCGGEQDKKTQKSEEDKTKQESKRFSLVDLSKRSHAKELPFLKCAQKNLAYDSHSSKCRQLRPVEEKLQGYYARDDAGERIRFKGNIIIWESRDFRIMGYDLEDVEDDGLGDFKGKMTRYRIVEGRTKGLCKFDFSIWAIGHVKLFKESCGRLIPHLYLLKEEAALTEGYCSDRMKILEDGQCVVPTGVLGEIQGEWQLVRQKKETGIWEKMDETLVIKGRHTQATFYPFGIPSSLTFIEEEVIDDNDYQSFFVKTDGDEDKYRMSLRGDSLYFERIAYSDYQNAMLIRKGTFRKFLKNQ